MFFGVPSSVTECLTELRTQKNMAADLPVMTLHPLFIYLVVGSVLYYMAGNVFGFCIQLKDNHYFLIDWEKYAHTLAQYSLRWKPV